MIALVTFVAIVMAARTTYQRIHGERDAIQRLRELGADVTTETAAPTWLQRLAGCDEVEHTTAVVFEPNSSCRSADMDTVCRDLVALTRLRTLRFHGDAIRNRHLARLSRLYCLETLELGGADVTIEAVETLADAMPDVEIDLAFAESVYHTTRRALDEGTISPHAAVYRFRKACEWKLACARFKPPGAEAVAYRQLIRWLDSVIRCMRDRSNSAEPFQPEEIAYVECARWDVCRKTALSAGNHGEALRAARAGENCAEGLRSPGWENSFRWRDHRRLAPWQTGSAIESLLLTLELRADLRVAHANLSRNREQASAALREYVADLTRIAEEMRPHVKAWHECGGNTLTMAEVWLADAQARLARASANAEEALRILTATRPRLAQLGKAWNSVPDLGGPSADVVLLQSEKVFVMETARAKMLRDAGHKKLARKMYDAHLQYRLASDLTFLDSDYETGPNGRLQRQVCVWATVRLGREGSSFYYDRRNTVLPGGNEPIQMVDDWLAARDEWLRTLPPDWEEPFRVPPGVGYL